MWASQNLLYRNWLTSTRGTYKDIPIPTWCQYRDHSALVNWATKLHSSPRCNPLSRSPPQPWITTQINRTSRSRLSRSASPSENQLLEAFSIQYDIPFWPKLPLDNFDADFTSRLPIQFLKKYLVVPLINDTPSPVRNKDLEKKDQQNTPKTVDNTGAVIAINNPVHIQPLDDMVRILGFSSRPVMTTLAPISRRRRAVARPNPDEHAVWIIIIKESST